MQPAISGIAEFELRLQEAGQVQPLLFNKALTVPATFREILEFYSFLVWQQAVLLETLHAAVTANKGNAADADLLARLVEKIRLIADSNITTRGKATNQLQLYLSAAQAAGADVTGINSFVARMRRGEPVSGALRTITVSVPVHELIQQTYVLVRTAEVQELAAAYYVSAAAAGLPQRLLEFLSLPAQKKLISLERAHYYFAQYTTLFTDLYQPSLRSLLSSLCGSDPQKWQAAAEAALTISRVVEAVIGTAYPSR